MDVELQKPGGGSIQSGSTRPQKLPAASTTRSCCHYGYCSSPATRYGSLRQPDLIQVALPSLLLLVAIALGSTATATTSVGRLAAAALVMPSVVPFVVLAAAGLSPLVACHRRPRRAAGFCVLVLAGE